MSAIVLAATARSSRWDWIVAGVGRPSLRVQDDTASRWVPKTPKSYRPVPVSDRAQEVLELASAKWGRTDYMRRRAESSVPHASRGAGVGANSW